MQTFTQLAMKELGKIILEEIQKADEAILNGTIGTMEEYKRLTSRRNTLLEFDDFVEEARKRVEKSE